MHIVYELTPSRFNIVAPLFTKVWYDKALIDSIFEGARPARVFVDNLDRPTAALIAAPSGEVYVAGRVDDGGIRQLLSDLPAEAEVFAHDDLTLHAPQPEWYTALEKDLAITFDVLRPFRYNQREMASPEGGSTVRKVDRSLLKDIYEGRLLLSHHMPDLETIYRDGFGWVVLCGEQIASMAWASAISSWYASLKAYTLPEKRQRGLARLALAASIREVLGHRLTPLFAATSKTKGAAHLALSLGFEEGRPQYIYPVSDGLFASHGKWRPEEHPPGVVPDSIVWMRVADVVFRS